MSTELTNTSKLREFVEELKRLKIEIIRPSINESFAEFKTEKNKIYYGLGAISLRQGDMQSALIAFKKAVEMNPKDTKVQRVLGYIYDQLGGQETG